MENSNVRQSALVLLSVTVLALTVGACWWVADLPEGVATTKRLKDRSVHPELEVDSATTGWDRDEAGSHRAAETTMKLAAFEQQSLDAPSSTALRVPDGGVPVPVAGSSDQPSPRSGALSYKGILAFVHDVKVVAQADGVIREFRVDEGSVVEKDSVIVEIDNRLAKAEEDVARKKLESAVLKAEDESQIKFATASEEVARSDFNRTEDLYRKEVANIDEYERKRLEWIKSNFSIDVSKREQKINQAEVGVTQAQLNAAGVQVELRTIRAPFTGIVAKTDRENFEWVKAGDEIMRLVSLDSFRVRGRVQIDDSPNILERAPAKVSVQIQPGIVETVNGVVGFVEPETSVAVDGKNEYAVWVEIPNRVVGGQYLFRGKMNATVEIYPNR